MGSETGRRRLLSPELLEEAARYITKIALQRGEPIAFAGGFAMQEYAAFVDEAEWKRGRKK